MSRRKIVRSAAGSVCALAIPGGGGREGSYLQVQSAMAFVSGATTSADETGIDKLGISDHFREWAGGRGGGGLRDILRVH